MEKSEVAVLCTNSTASNSVQNQACMITLAKAQVQHNAFDFQKVIVPSSNTETPDSAPGIPSSNGARWPVKDLSGRQWFRRIKALVAPFTAKARDRDELRTGRRWVNTGSGCYTRYVTTHFPWHHEEADWLMFLLRSWFESPGISAQAWLLSHTRAALGYHTACRIKECIRIA